MTTTNGLLVTILSDLLQWMEAKIVSDFTTILKQELQTMSASISAQIDAVTAKLQVDLDTITTEIAGLNTQITDLKNGLPVGTVVVQAQVDALAAIETRAAALATPVVVTPPAA